MVCQCQLVCPILDISEFVLSVRPRSRTSLSTMSLLLVPSTEGRAGEALDDEAGVSVSMSKLALLDWLLVRCP
jgi:hypothetical protein